MDLRSRADVVAPISYAIADGQHYGDLKSYKSYSPAPLAGGRLAAITQLFVLKHVHCLASKAQIEIKHFAVVPSTRGKPPPHPLVRLLNLEKSAVDIGVSKSLKDHREFDADWFRASPPAGGWQGGVLLLDDLWTTGAHIQSAAGALKQAGAPVVIAVPLGRFLKPTWPPSIQLIRMIEDQQFDVDRCTICSAS